MAPEQPAFYSNVAPRIVRREALKPWGECAATGRPHYGWLLECADCGKRKPSP